MPKKSIRQREEEGRLVAWYKWEFLRRNVAYRKDYEEFIREFGGWFRKHGYWYDQTTKPWGANNLRFFAAEIAPKVRVICTKWGIREPFPPEWEFTESGMYSYSPHWSVCLPTDCDGEAAGSMWDLSFMLQSFDEFAATLPDFGEAPQDCYFSPTFDLRLPLASLLREARNQITSHKAKYDRKHAKPARIAPAVRRRLDRYKVYLEVWDRKRRGEKYLSIGVDLFGDEPRVEQRAIDSFKRAQELIDGGYKELR
jgi:hypothetical protein